MFRLGKNIRGWDKIKKGHLLYGDDSFYLTPMSSM